MKTLCVDQSTCIMCTVVSPGPMAPVNVLCQVLPPEMSMQLLSEITTAISPDEDGDVYVFF